ncbi:hypothetical protein BA70_15105 [Bacillus zhangzhouensis]|uniref:SGNH hydrolase-type esterase domain-containing protein n=1 Tax=Bacillus zhangzhouensis TaxID=1178540 RepID=A0A081LCN7_9BACI|nr:hypothetical protein BA70_15105 [Bacillus zhangzhouensis]
MQESVIAFGDSNTRGSNWDFRDYPTSEKWVNLMKNVERGQIQVKNAGIGGQTTEDAKLRFEQDILKQKPTYVLIMFSTMFRPLPISSNVCMKVINYLSVF